MVVVAAKAERSSVLGRRGQGQGGLCVGVGRGTGPLWKMGQIIRMVQRWAGHTKSPPELLLAQIRRLLPILLTDLELGLSILGCFLGSEVDQAQARVGCADSREAQDRAMLSAGSLAGNLMEVR